MPGGEALSSYQAGRWAYDLARYMGIVPDVVHELSSSDRDDMATIDFVAGWYDSS